MVVGVLKIGLETVGCDEKHNPGRGRVGHNVVTQLMISYSLDSDFCHLNHVVKMLYP